MLASASVRPTRRRVLAAVAATGSVALAGSACDVVGDPAAPPTEGARGPSGTPTAHGEDADERLVAEVAREVAAALAVVTAAGRERPALSRALAGLTRTHRAHLAELPAPAGRPRVRVVGDAQEVLARVRSVERRVQRRLADAAVEAESGALAALLASMSAAVAQQLATEPLA